MNIAEPTPAHVGLELDRIFHRYGDTPVVDGVSLSIAPGELVALLGPSGCGKTTLLKIVAGFNRQTAGQVRIGGARVDHLPPNQRRVGIVFQNYALFPHMTVAQNVAYGLDVMRVERAAKAARVSQMLELVRMGGFAARYPRQLSGGQQQRVAIARALAVRPTILLLDEPFAALDKALRLDMQIELKRIQRDAGTTTILVTHDQEEALSLADRVALLNRGRLEQFASPTEIYDRPASLFVNTFVGSANVLTGKVAVAQNGRYTVLLTVGGAIDATSPIALPVGTSVQVCLRPEALAVTPRSDGLPATVEIGLRLGASIIHELRLADGTALKSTAPRKIGDEPMPSGTRVRLHQQSPAIAFPA
ncbi:MAG: putative spermidine/putrescine transport system ATP-binding protein [Acetobacteraceae bacterium]|nr:putative spermidine/putrescine transport system ATP-binding protein [Acetobacteraceae bacterium]